MPIRFDSPAYRAWAALADLVILSVLTLAGALPVVTAGASLAASTRVLGEVARGEEPVVWREWLRRFRAELAVSLAWWLPTLVLVAGAAGMNLWLSQAVVAGVVPAGGAALVRGLLGAGALLWLGLLVWLVPLTVWFENAVGAHVANAARLAVGCLGRTAACLVVLVGLPVLAWCLTTFGLASALVVGWFLVLVGPGLVLYVVALVQRPVLSRLTTVSGASE